MPAGAELTEDANGNLAIADSSGSIVLVRDETAGQWDLNNNSLTGINAINASSANVESLDTGQAVIGGDGPIQGVTDQALGDDNRLTGGVDDRLPDSETIREATYYWPADDRGFASLRELVEGEDATIEGATWARDGSFVAGVAPDYVNDDDYATVDTPELDPEPAARSFVCGLVLDQEGHTDDRRAISESFDPDDDSDGWESHSIEVDDNNELAANVRDTGTVSLHEGEDFPLGVFQVVGYAYEGNEELVLYRNGDRVADTSIGEIDSRGNLLQGIRFAVHRSLDRPWRGPIDTAVIWEDRKLTDGEMAEVHDAFLEVGSGN